MSFIATGIIGGAAVIGGAVMSSNAASNAASTEANAANNATSAQLGMFGQEQATEHPYVQAGSQAESQIMGNMGSWNAPFTLGQFYSSENPGYGFQLQQGLASTQAAESAGGAEYGTGTLAAMNNYAQNQANGQYQQAFQNYQQQVQGSYNRLAGIAQLGQGAAANSGAAAISAGQNIGNNITQAGTASAAGQVGSANAYSGALGQIGGGAMSLGMLNKFGSQNQQTGDPTSNWQPTEMTQPSLLNQIS